MKQMLVYFVGLIVMAVVVNLLYVMSGHATIPLKVAVPVAISAEVMREVYHPSISTIQNTTIKTLQSNETKTEPTTVQNSTVKTIRRMNGYKSHRAPKLITCGEYECRVVSGKKSKGADLVFFNERDVDHYIKPPKKDEHVLWGFMSKEPQNHIKFADNALWDSLFNYSITYARQSDGVFYNFRDKIVKRPSPRAKDFAAQHKARQPRALWFVSHCLHRWKKHRVWSGRVEYVLELSKYLPIDVYTRTASCRKQLGSLIKSATKGHQPQLSKYTFYLSFESTLCTDYISEKFWKVLEAKQQTIPIALGAQSIAEYELVAPPNSFIHVRNFSSPEALANHLKLIARDDNAFNYYHQWKNEYSLLKKKKTIKYIGDYNCYFCRQAHERPENVWNTFSKDFGRHQCLDVSTPDVYCTYYNLTCNSSQTSNISTTSTLALTTSSDY